MRTKLYILLCIIVLSYSCQHVMAQVNTYGNAVPSIRGENVFFDASATFDLSVTGGSTGKGFVFPRVDLTQWIFKIVSLSDGSIFPGAFDGMIVYNIVAGNTKKDVTGINNPLISVSVTPGFYYFSNPGPTDGTHTSIANGKWVRISDNQDLVNRISVLSAAPTTSLYDGLVYFNTTLNKFFRYSGAPVNDWVAVGGGAAEAVSGKLYQGTLLPQNDISTLSWATIISGGSTVTSIGGTVCTLNTTAYTWIAFPVGWGNIIFFYKYSGSTYPVFDGFQKQIFTAAQTGSVEYQVWLFKTTPDIAVDLIANN
jgi:hypothetical protein